MDTKAYEKERYVAFVDLLGYKHIVTTTSFTEAERSAVLKHVYEKLDTAVQGCTNELDDSGDLRFIAFSDCYYFSSGSATRIVTSLSCFFRDVLFGCDIGGSVGTEWVPFLRGGIIYGWYLDAHDASVEGASRVEDLFRNPIGPAVANAYLLSEETGIRGMRLAVTQKVTDSFAEQLEATTGLNAERTSKLSPIPYFQHETFGQVYEIPWFEDCLSDAACYDVLKAISSAKWQFSPQHLKHYWGTLEGIRGCPSVEEPEHRRFLCHLERLLADRDA